jgi:pyridoxal 5'-phosphate synthase pdxT subunit
MISPRHTGSPSVAGNSTPLIGVLALQGDVREHRQMLEELGCEVREVRKPSHLVGLNGLVLPGGESSVMDKLLRIFEISTELRDAIAGGLPVLGTCAGLIMLASELEDGIAGQETVGGLDVTVRRNAFGSQVDSYETDVTIAGVQGPPVRVAFIRAPVVTRVGPGVEAIATLPDGDVVGVRQGAVMGVAFHPEITGDDRLHRIFVESVRSAGFRLASLQTA